MLDSNIHNLEMVTRCCHILDKSTAGKCMLTSTGFGFQLKSSRKNLKNQKNQVKLKSPYESRTGYGV